MGFRVRWLKPRSAAPLGIPGSDGLTAVPTLCLCNVGTQNPYSGKSVGVDLITITDVEMTIAVYQGIKRQ